MCQLCGVSRATYYRLAAGLEERSEEECELRDQVERIALRWPYYGSRRIQAQLNQDGWEVSRKRVQRILREEGLLCLRQPTSWLATTDSKHHLAVFPNLAAGCELSGINQLWVTDITYIRLPRGFVFLAAMLDAFSRKVIGWALQETMQAGLCIEALQQAMVARHYPRGVIHHSDRGVQYCSKEYTALLERYHMRGSMARKGNPYDNAKAESFWKTLKYEQVYRHDYRSIHEARQNIGQFIDQIYNQTRLHSALGYCSPANFEAAQKVTR
jgi:transposase InsO family protein